MKTKAVVATVLRFIAAVLLLQTLYFKFTAHEESVWIFTRLGMEPWGRVGTGVLELIAAILLLNGRTAIWGATLALGLMAGAIFFHLTKLGINVSGDPLLFIYAVTVFLASVILLLIYRARILQLLGIRQTHAV
ncbi:MAG TPA: DoxX family protein [Chitinophagaceae bacterium]|nr:DoxX family protein [Chitinophagaceae bacterium]